MSLLLLIGCSGGNSKSEAKEMELKQKSFYPKVNELETRYHELSSTIEKRLEDFNQMLAQEGGAPTMQNVSLGEEISFLRAKSIEVLIEKCEQMKLYISALESQLGSLVDPKEEYIRQGSFEIE